MDAGGRAPDNLRNGLGQRGNLGLEIGAGGAMPLQDGDEDRQSAIIDWGFVFRILASLEGPHPNPGLGRRRTERAASRIGERLRKIVRRFAIGADDDFNR